MYGFCVAATTTRIASFWVISCHFKPRTPTSIAFFVISRTFDFIVTTEEEGRCKELEPRHDFSHLGVGALMLESSLSRSLISKTEKIRMSYLLTVCQDRELNLKQKYPDGSQFDENQMVEKEKKYSFNHPDFCIGNGA
jgi:hypothetical protein